jgi:preprotein translocase subunit SecG
MYQVIIVVHVLLGLGVIGLVMMQQGKGADAGAAFGSASSGSVFGAQGAASFLSRTTGIFAALFFATSLGLAILGGYQNKPIDLMDEPAGENLKADVPLVNNSQVTDTLPLVQEDDAAQQLIDQVTDTIEKTDKQLDTTAEEVIETLE